MKRANLPEEKARRRASIIEAAMNLFEANGGVVPRVADIAEAAGVAKGTVYLYFRSREAIELALLSDAFSGCFDVLDAALNSEMPVFEMLDVMGAFLLETPVLVRLGSRYNALMEDNADLGAVVAFKTLLFKRLSITGRTLSRRIRGLSEPEARGLLIRSFSAVIGLWQMAEPVPIVKDALEMEGLSELDLVFADELSVLLTDLWSGALMRVESGN